jgi:hypothetical protein
VSTPTANTTTAKLAINSTIFTLQAKYIGGNIKTFYLGTPIARYEYMQLSFKLMPNKIIKAYNLHSMIYKDHIYKEIRCGMYGLGLLANQLLTKSLGPHGYEQCHHTPGLWWHQWQPILFSLVLDDFGMKYVGKWHANHLIKAIEANYNFSKDWEGQLYCGIKLNWDYTKPTINLSIPGYIQATLHKYQHPSPKQEQNAQHTWTEVGACILKVLGHTEKGFWTTGHYNIPALTYCMVVGHDFVLGFVLYLGGFLSCVSVVLLVPL